MRNQLTLSISNKKVIVREITPANLRNIAKLVSTELSNIKMLDMLNNHWDALLSGVGDCVQLPPDWSLESCGLSTLSQIWQGFVKVNPDFFRLAEAVAGSQISNLLSSLTPTPTTSPSVDTSTSGITDSAISPDAVS